MKLLTFEDIINLNIDATSCFNWVSEMIQNKKNTQLPPKISMHPNDGVFCNFMPSIIPDTVFGSVGGIKIVNRYPDRVPSLDSKLLLMDMDNGDFLALMDANWITAMRTGAVAVHSMKYLAKSDFNRISLLGLGNTARATIYILANVFPEREFDIKLLKYKEQEKSFVDRFKDYDNLHFTFVDDMESLVKFSHVVISCVTYLENDICQDEYFDEGILVIPVHTRGFTNCDLFFDKIYADDYGHVCHFKNFHQFKYFAEMCDVVNGTAVGRENDRERILAYNIGLSIHDINYANHIYQMIKDDPKYNCFDMKNPVNKFWV
ncbi:MAG: ornithine cyclodeaminase [Lachnospiraceae bacterium]